MSTTLFESPVFSCQTCLCQKHLYLARHLTIQSNTAVGNEMLCKAEKALASLFVKTISDKCRWNQSVSEKLVASF